MYSVSKEAIAELRHLTGAGVLAVRQSLVSAEGDMQKAIEILRIQ